MKPFFPFLAGLLFLIGGCVSVNRNAPETSRTTTTVSPPLAPSASVTTRTTTY